MFAERFPWLLPPTEADIAASWNEGIFCVDANVLLHLYRLPIKTVDEVVGAFERLKDRLWVPNYVAFEFLSNRLAVIADQLSKFADALDVIRKSDAKLRSQLEDLQVGSRYASIDVSELLRDYGDFIDKSIKSLESQQLAVPQMRGDDPILERLTRLFEGKIGSPFANQQEIDKIDAEAESRFSSKIPPGYQDAGKSSSDRPYLILGDQRYQRKNGDLYLWRQLLDEAAKRKFKHVVFISDDRKEDWLEIVKGERVSPRMELSSELFHKIRCDNLLIYSFKRFLEVSNKRLGSDISEESFEQIEAVIEAQIVEKPEIGVASVAAFKNYLAQRYGEQSLIEFDDDGVDFLVTRSDGGRLGFVCKVTANPKIAAAAIKNFSDQMSDIISYYGLKKVYLCLIVANRRVASAVAGALRQIGLGPARSRIWVGTVEDDPSSGERVFRRIAMI